MLFFICPLLLFSFLYLPALLLLYP